jgi:hypothetical protein
MCVADKLKSSAILHNYSLPRPKETPHWISYSRKEKIKPEGELHKLGFDI